MYDNSLIVILTQVVLLAGLFGLLIPIFPGMLIIWLAALGYGLLTDWSTLGVILFLLITILTIVGMLADNVFMGVGARQTGVPWLTLAVAFAAGLLGTLALPPIGGIIALPAALLIMEYRRHGTWDQALASFRGLAKGWGIGFVVRFGIGLIIMFLWWMWVLFG